MIRFPYGKIEIVRRKKEDYMQDQTIKLNDGRTLGFSDYGNPNDIPIILFHGTPGSRVYGLEESSILEKFGIRIVAPERPGYGLSTPYQNRKILDWADDVKELTNYLGINRFHIAGESGGGPYVLACAIKMSARVLTATLIGSACPPEALQFSKGMTLGNKIDFLLAKHMPFVLKWASKNFSDAIEKYPDKIMQKLISQFCEWDRQIIEKGGENKRKTLLLHFKEAFRQGYIGHFDD